MLKLLTQPDKIDRLSRPALTQLLEDHREHVPVSAEWLLTTNVRYQEWCAAWAGQFKALETFGAPLAKALTEIETLALPENRALLDEGIGKLPAGYVDTSQDPLQQSLHFWLIAHNTAGSTYPEVRSEKCEGRNGNSQSPIENSQAANSLPGPAAEILDALVGLANRFLVLPKWVAETIALFILHTYAWELRDVTTYLGIESPQHRCGKSTLLAFLRRLVNRAEGAAHISSPAFFRAIQRGKPTLLVDQTEKILGKNDILCGILNASYMRDLAYVIRVVPQSKKSGNGSEAEAEYVPLEGNEEKGRSEKGEGRNGNSQSPIANCQGRDGQSPIDDSPGPESQSQMSDGQDDVGRFSCWCPKVMAQVGHFPETLADRCIIITMQRKTPAVSAGTQNRPGRGR